MSRNAGDPLDLAVLHLRSSDSDQRVSSPCQRSRGCQTVNSPTDNHRRTYRNHQRPLLMLSCRHTQPNIALVKLLRPQKLHLIWWWMGDRVKRKMALPASIRFNPWSELVGPPGLVVEPLPLFRCSSAQGVYGRTKYGIKSVGCKLTQRRREVDGPVASPEMWMDDRGC